MSFKKCPNCGKKITNKSISCLTCGADCSDNVDKKIRINTYTKCNFKTNKKLLIIKIIISLILSLFLLMILYLYIM